MLKYRIVGANIILSLLFISAMANALAQDEIIYDDSIKVGAELDAQYLDLLKDKRVAVLGNQTSMVGDIHTVDYLLDLGIDIKKVFAPEHGFRGVADAGEHVEDGIDSKTGIAIKSLYGDSKKPTAEDLKDIEVMVFDIQDVGARFYTYISTLHYIMEACAENGIPVIVLDRPNPNGYFVDGPVLDPKFSSFVGMHPVPVVYGMTIGEYAQMINGEGWLKDGIKAELSVIQIRNYTHDKHYQLPIKPSPNLPNSKSILLYPSLCFFEGTIISVGRGTDQQFQCYGHPDFSIGSYAFKPEPNEGAKYPRYEGKQCFGANLSGITIGNIRDQKALNLSYLLGTYDFFKGKEEYFLENKFFDKLAGTDELRLQILDGKTEEEIRASWQKDLENFKLIRNHYLIYE